VWRRIAQLPKEEDEELAVEPKPPRDVVLDDDDDQLLVEDRDDVLDEVVEDGRVCGTLPQEPPRGSVAVRLTVVRDGRTMSAITAPATRPIVRPEPVE
jgi:hypothetical protein